MKVGLVYDPIYLKHETGHHVERPARLKAVMELLEKEGVLPKLSLIPPRKAEIENIALNHSPQYINFISQKAMGGGGWLDADTIMCPASHEVALYATGGMLQAVDKVMSGEIDTAFCLVRPPGHHATPQRAMGFCLFNNIAIAAKYALKNFSLSRILIVDFDVHHGNGTQDAFYADPSVLYFSTHQSPLYPGTGRIEEIGRGNIANVPLPPGCGDEEFKKVYEQLLVPLTHRFMPQLILVSAGYDAHWLDPIAQMGLSVNGFAHIAKTIKNLASQLCQGRLIFTLEGGYDLQALCHSLKATLDVLLGEERIADPLGLPPQWRKVPPVCPIIEAVRERHKL